MVEAVRVVGVVGDQVAKVVDVLVDGVKVAASEEEKVEDNAEAIDVPLLDAVVNITVSS